MESPEHLYQKERVRDIARNKGYIAEVEVPFTCWAPYHDKPVSYSADVFILLDRNKPLVVEIDGDSHSSSYQHNRDKNRTDNMQNLWGDHIRVKRFPLGELINASDEDILYDLGIGEPLDD